MFEQLFNRVLGADGLLIGTLLPFFAVLVVVIFIHELGHYLVGRWCGIGVKAFAIGFGPELFGWNDKRGTRWKLCAIPLGGYVKFVGDVGATSAPDSDSLTHLPAEERAVAFQAQALWKRALTVLAGPVANFLLAIVLLSGFFYVYGKNVADPVVASVRDGSPAAEAGLQPGDKFVSLQGKPVASFADVQRVVTGAVGVPLDFVFERDGEEFAVVLTPVEFSQDDGLGNTAKFGIIGVGADRDRSNLRREYLSPVASVAAAVDETVHTIQRTMSFLGRLVQGNEDRCQLGGPVKIAQMAGAAADQGLNWLISLTAMLSIGIGILNLMPVPPLDGGHLAIYAAEGIARRPLPERVTEMFYQVGFFAVLALMAFVFYNDLFGC